MKALRVFLIFMLGGGMWVGCKKQIASPDMEYTGGTMHLLLRPGQDVETEGYGGILVRANGLLVKRETTIPIEIRTHSASIPSGFTLISPVVHMRFHRDDIAMDDPRVSSLLGMGVGVTVRLPVDGAYGDIRALVVVNGRVLGVLFTPEEVQRGYASIRIPAGLYFSMFPDDPTLDVELFLVRMGEEENSSEERAELSGFGIVERPGMTGIYVADRRDGWNFRWIPRLYQSVPVGSVEIPATDLKAGLVRPLRVLLVHGFGVIYHNTGGWIGPDPDETWSDFVSHLQSAAGGATWLKRTEVLAFNHSFLSVSHAVEDLRRALRQIGEQFTHGTPTQYVLVGHSMGGLIVRNLYDANNDHYASVVTLGSPLHGSWLADLVLQLAGDGDFYVTRLASYMANEVIQQCIPPDVQDPIRQWLGPYIQRLDNAKVALDGIFYVASRQGLEDLTYDWSAPLHFYVPGLDCFVTLDPNDPDFPSSLKRGALARGLNQRDQSAQPYLYVAFSDPYGGNDFFYNITSGVLAAFHNTYERRVIPNIRHNDGLVWVKSARNDFGPGGAILGRWSIPQANGNHTALRTVYATASRVANVLQGLNSNWESAHSGFVVGLGWGTYRSGVFNLMEWATGYFTKNLDLAIFRDPTPGDNEPSYLPLVGYLKEGSSLPQDLWQSLYGGVHYGDVQEPGGTEWAEIAQPQGGAYYIAVRKTHNGTTSPIFEPTLNDKTVRVGVFGSVGDTVIDGPSSWPSGDLWWVVAKIQSGQVSVINVTAPETTVVETLRTPGADIPDTVITRRLIRYRDGGRLVLTTQETKTPICETP